MMSVVELAAREINPAVDGAFSGSRLLACLGRLRHHSLLHLGLQLRSLSKPLRSLVKILYRDLLF